MKNPKLLLVGRSVPAIAAMYARPQKKGLVWSVQAVNRAPETKDSLADSTARTCQRTGIPDRELEALRVSQ